MFKTIFLFYQSLKQMTKYVLRKTFLTVMYSLYCLGLHQLPEPIPTEMEIYEKQIKTKFIAATATATTATAITDMNSNMDKIIYDRPSYKKLMEEANNYLEKQWRSRIMYEHTPRGNIIMYYDTYREGFAYYSDQTGIPYKLLNMVAMKYTMIYRCMDFFVDNQYITENKSPMIEYMYKEMETEEEVKRKVMDGLLQKQPSFLTNDSSSPFVKFQNYSTATTTTKNKENPTTTEIETSKKKEYITNKFTYMGKCMNFDILQRMPKKKMTQTIPKTISYTSFKNIVFD